MMTQDKQLFFLALLPPLEVQQYARQIQQHFAQVYNSRAALKSPPHITLQPPFKLDVEELPKLQQKLTNFAINYAPVPIILDNFNAFQPRVIYIDVIKTPELLTVQKELDLWLNPQDNSQKRPFVPHLTVAFRDLTKDNFRKAWLEFEYKKLHFDFFVSEITFLKHNGRKWVISQQFLLNNNKN